MGSVEQRLWGGIDEYCGLKLEALSPALPVAASADHDGRLVGLMQSALAAFHQVIERDVSNVRRVGQNMASADGAVAAKLGAGRAR